MIKYLEMVPLLFWSQKLDLDELSISEMFEDLLSWNLESKLITPKNITGTYFGAIMAIFNFSFSVYFLYVIFFLTLEGAPKAGPATCFYYFHKFLFLISKLFTTLRSWDRYSNHLIHTGYPLEIGWIYNKQQ